ncbi:solute carrier organic anion transporter family member 4A1 isoform X1 [Ornithorhynchus anatinus]|uniref:Solute carrier organic anion transporter family member n=1 Tax=Ornithorhynchus anatinus TaxID=9258 RepID=F7DID9_ORNAN|nr:solute carrier organic anion transporter family member 4A1 isoform X1 [Ornithorhynchus anatinus]XP_016080822.1 solute carrier organic anion transporter family member 4A1 isoform X1 [Ornithorhynchus anatinus]XP_028926527.1 solute carrier organic anion transporter family member 4A1 isoform X1 [Ornithorhynchus anatinus]
MEMPHSETVENGYSDMANSQEHGKPLSNDTLHSNAISPLDSCKRPLCDTNSGPKKQCKKINEENTACGWGPFKPDCLQVCNTPKGILFFLCLASFLQGMTVNGLINTVITSLERRFDLHSYQSGLIASSYDIAACVCLTFVSYFGGNGHKPQWLGWGILVMGFGSFVFTLPQFATSSYKVNFSEEIGMCHSNQSAPCTPSTSSLSNYRFIFMLGQFLHGIGATPLYTLGVTYLDENVKTSYSPVYIAIFYTAAILGPAAGYLIGGSLLNIYTEIGSHTDLTPENPLWVGAWWIGFVGAGAAAFLIALPILGYPRQLPGSQRYVVMRRSETHQLKDGSDITTANPDFGKTVKDLPLSIWLLLKNPTFFLLCLAGATEATLISGMSTFGPKFLESQLSLSASDAATLFGYLVVPAGGGGTFLGGFFVNKFKLRCSGMIKFCLFCTLISFLATSIFFLHCPNMPMAGVTLHSNRTLPEGILQLMEDCNENCECLTENYSPICGSNNIMYYSPCLAGCTKGTILPNGQKVYRNCSCIPQGHATAGKCTSSCEKKSLLLLFMFIAIFFTFLSSIPALTATLRCVSDRQRSFALGIQWIVVRTLGAIPGPIAFGWVIDKACILWQTQCGDQGSCYVYQNSDMSKYTLTAGFVYKVLGFVFFLIALLLYKPPTGSPKSLPSTASDDNPDLSENHTPLPKQNGI